MDQSYSFSSDIHTYAFFTAGLLMIISSLSSEDLSSMSLHPRKISAFISLHLLYCPPLMVVYYKSYFHQSSSLFCMVWFWCLTIWCHARCLTTTPPRFDISLSVSVFVSLWIWFLFVFGKGRWRMQKNLDGGGCRRSLMVEETSQPWSQWLLDQLNAFGL